MQPNGYDLDFQVENKDLLLNDDFSESIGQTGGRQSQNQLDDNRPLNADDSSLNLSKIKLNTNFENLERMTLDFDSNDGQKFAFKLSSKKIPIWKK